MHKRLQWQLGSQIPNRRRILFFGKLLLAVGVLWALKRLAHDLNLDVLSVDPPFMALIFTTLALLAILLLGVLADFKESERLPAEAATILEVLSLELASIPAHQPQARASEGQASISSLAVALLDWLLSRISMDQLLVVYRCCYRDMVLASVLLQAQPQLQGRMTLRMESLLRIINRINTIRDTSFAASIHWMALLGTGLTCAGLVFTKLDTTLESNAFLLIISFALLFMIRMISDLDNPFGFNDEDSAEDVSLDPLLACIQRLPMIPGLLEP